MWLRNASQAVQDETKALIALLSSRLAMPAPPMAPNRANLSSAPGKLQQTWKHALHEEVRRAMMPLRERIAGLAPPAIGPGGGGLLLDVLLLMLRAYKMYA